MRPLSAGRGRLTIAVACGGHTSVVPVDYVALARLSVSAVDQTGGSPPIKLLLDGKEVAGDARGGTVILY